jgi:phage terminase small subunit
MNRGQKPNSAQVFDITGGKSKIGASTETEPVPGGEVVMPSHVKGVAAKIWKEKAPDLIAKNALTAWDVDLFAKYCILEARFRKKPEEFTGNLLTEQRRIAECFGMSGAQSRARIKTKPVQSASPAAKYFENRTS